jgi:hypothetical protein
MESLKHSPDVWVIIDANYYLAFAAAHEGSHALVILERKVHSIADSLPVRRVHVMKGIDAVVALGALEPGKIFDVGARQALPSGGEVFFNPQQVDGRAGGGGTERLSSDRAGEGMVLQVEETCGALDLGEGFVAGHLLTCATSRELAPKLSQAHTKLARARISVGVNVGVFFWHEKAQPFQIGLSH